MLNRCSFIDNLSVQQIQFTGEKSQPVHRRRFFVNDTKRQRQNNLDSSACLHSWFRPWCADCTVSTMENKQTLFIIQNYCCTAITTMANRRVVSYSQRTKYYWFEATAREPSHYLRPLPCAARILSCNDHSAPMA